MAKTKDTSFRKLLVCPSGPVDLSQFEPRETPGFKGGKDDALKELPGYAARLADLQERLYAAATAGDRRRVLLVLQGMDTAGKGGVVKHVVGAVNPIGCQIKAFKAPTREELAHDFLWRIRRALPAAGELGVFDRSHYEDVLVVRVRDLASRAVWSRRYATINRFEDRLTADGCTVVKCFLHISADAQQERLLERLDDPAKYWKYNPSDVDDRELWPAFQEAYAAALEKCNTDAAPWYVIPSDRKWYRNYAITRLLVEVLEGMDLGWPSADFSVDDERKRLAAVRVLTPAEEGQLGRELPAPEGLVVAAGADAAGRIAEFGAERGVLCAERVVVAAVDPDRYPAQHGQRGGGLDVVGREVRRAVERTGVGRDRVGVGAEHRR
jgi:PPK2 family polyphosphate:nucleotide phosphotransferase